MTRAKGLIKVALKSDSETLKLIKTAKFANPKSSKALSMSDVYMAVAFPNLDKCALTLGAFEIAKPIKEIEYSAILEDSKQRKKTSLINVSVKNSDELLNSPMAASYMAQLNFSRDKIEGFDCYTWNQTTIVKISDKQISIVMPNTNLKETLKYASGEIKNANNLICL